MPGAGLSQIVIMYRDGLQTDSVNIILDLFENSDKIIYVLGVSLDPRLSGKTLADVFFVGGEEYELQEVDEPFAGADRQCNLRIFC